MHGQQLRTLTTSPPCNGLITTSTRVARVRANCGRVDLNDELRDGEVARILLRVGAVPRRYARSDALRAGIQKLK